MLYVMVDILVMFFMMYIGLLASVIIPYKRKKAENKIDVFDPKFWKHAIVTAVWEFIAGLTLYLGWNPPAEFLLYDVAILVIAFSLGYGGLEGQKQAEKVIRLLITFYERRQNPS